jgi:hypothetical protein
LYWYTLYIFCWYVSPHTTTQNCTTLQPSISTHTQKYTITHTNTSHSHKNHILCTFHYFACWLSQFCYTWVAFPFSILIVFVYCILLYLCIVCLCIYLCICVYIYCCFRYLNGVCPIRDGHCGHQKTPTQWFSLCRHVVVTPLRLLHPLSLNSSIVFNLRQRIAYGWIVAANNSLLLLPTILYCCWQLDGFSIR